MINHVFCFHGLHTDVVSDRFPQFVARFWKEFRHLLGALVNLSSGFHTQFNGPTEITSQELKKSLRCLCSQKCATWSKSLFWVEYAYNSLPMSSTGFSPFHGAYGYQPPLFPVQERAVSVSCVQAFVQGLYTFAVLTLERKALLGASQHYIQAADKCCTPARSYCMPLNSMFGFPLMTCLLKWSLASWSPNLWAIPRHQGG